MAEPHRDPIPGSYAFATGNLLNSKGLTPEEVADLKAQFEKLGGHAAPVEFATDEHGQPTPHWPTAPE
jgi:hypothetical protein